MKHVSALAFSMVLAGCAVPYVAPTSGPSAKIRFVNEAHRNLHIAYFEQSARCVGRRKTDVIPPATEQEHIVRADSDLTFQYYLTNSEGGGSEQYCLLNLRFYPQAGNSYVFRTVEGRDSCKWLMVEATGSGAPTPVALKKISWKAGWDESSSWCDE